MNRRYVLVGLTGFVVGLGVGVGVMGLVAKPQTVPVITASVSASQAVKELAVSAVQPANVSVPSYQNTPTVTIPGTTLTAVRLSGTEAATFSHIQVINDKGQVEYLDASKQPVMFMAYWCPHCHDQLKAMSQMKLHTPPTLVSVWPEDKAHLEELTVSSMQQLGVTNLPVVYQPDQKIASSYAQEGVPTTVFMYQGQMYLVVGAQTSAANLSVMFGRQ